LVYGEKEAPLSETLNDKDIEDKTKDKDEDGEDESEENEEESNHDSNDSSERNTSESDSSNGSDPSEDERVNDTAIAESKRIVAKVYRNMMNTAEYCETRKLTGKRRINLFRKERDFLAGYFFRVWKKEPLSDTAIYRELLTDVMQCKTNHASVGSIEPNSSTSARGRKRKRNDDCIIKADDLDPIVISMSKETSFLSFASLYYE
jgi:hypothetical protein